MLFQGPGAVLGEGVGGAYSQPAPNTLFFDPLGSSRELVFRKECHPVVMLPPSISSHFLMGDIRKSCELVFIHETGITITTHFTYAVMRNIFTWPRADLKQEVHTFENVTTHF